MLFFVQVVGLSRVWNRCASSTWKKLLLCGYGLITYTLIEILNSVLVTVVFLMPSIHNYPGGYALLKMNVRERRVCEIDGDSEGYTEWRGGSSGSAY